MHYGQVHFEPWLVQEMQEDLCFPFVDTTSNVVFIFVTITVGDFSIKAFNVANKVCSLVLTGVGPLYIISPWLFYSQFRFLYFGRTSVI